jgi:hypothetical protein
MHKVTKELFSGYNQYHQSYILSFSIFPSLRAGLLPVRQGRVDEARKVLKKLQRRKDVSCEIVSLIQGTRIDLALCLQEYEFWPNETINDTFLLSLIENNCR